MCPTCANEMDRLNNLPAAMCHRCGTVVIEIRSRDHAEVDRVTIVPKLVERCREFAASTVYNSYLAPERLPLHMKEEWELGPGEAIYKPEDRPT